MATATATSPLLDALPEKEVQRLYALLEEVDSVELKLTIPEAAQFTITRALQLDPLESQMRQVFFFETPDLALDKAGLVVRARRSQRKGDDTVVKLRPVVPSELPKSLRRSSNFNVELDASPKGFVVSGSLKGFPSTGEVRATMLGNRKARKLFTKEQRSTYAERAPEGIALDDLVMLGPLFVLKLKEVSGFDRKLVTELWLYPDGSRILELSTKCEPSEAFDVAAQTRAFLASKGVDLDAEQQTKTRTALEYFAKTLA